MLARHGGLSTTEIIDLNDNDDDAVIEVNPLREPRVAAKRYIVVSHLPRRAAHCAARVAQILPGAEALRLPILQRLQDNLIHRAKLVFAKLYRAGGRRCPR
jgi:hypothetical protein